MLEILEPGLLTTVQDRGRPGLGHLGVPVSGACDPVALAAANVAVGNEPSAAALEVTLVGPRLRALAPTVVALGGADLGARIVGGRHVPPGACVRLGSGDVLELPGPVAGERGCRAYLALPGGIDVPEVLGSRSTCLVAAFGGLDGRALVAGDLVRPSRAQPSALAHLHGAASTHPVAQLPRFGGGPEPIRVLPGPDDQAGVAIRELVGREWTVAAASDRMGLRLDGEPLATLDDGSTLTHGVGWGSVQLPPGGRPIVLLADHQPTGGYPVVAVAILADRPALGQLAPGARVRFEPTTVEAAREALRVQRARLAELERIAAEDRTWEALWHDAGA
jgi:antagonist of KipI